MPHNTPVGKTLTIKLSVAQLRALKIARIVFLCVFAGAVFIALSAALDAWLGSSECLQYWLFLIIPLQVAAGVATIVGLVAWGAPE
jgi:hypothetical protein